MCCENLCSNRNLIVLHLNHHECLLAVLSLPFFIHCVSSCAPYMLFCSKTEDSKEENVDEEKKRKRKEQDRYYSALSLIHLKLDLSPLDHF